MIHRALFGSIERFFAVKAEDLRARAPLVAFNLVEVFCGP